jgi:hypothetical protein
MPPAASRRFRHKKDVQGCARFGAVLALAVLDSTPCLSPSLLSQMPIITNSSGFNIHGGNFYEVAGDVNLHTHHTHQRLTNGDHTQSAGFQMMARRPEAQDWSGDSGREWSGVMRNDRRSATAGRPPYNYGTTDRPGVQTFLIVGACLQIRFPEDSFRQGPPPTMRATKCH